MLSECSYPLYELPLVCRTCPPSWISPIIGHSNWWVTFSLWLHIIPTNKYYPNFPIFEFSHSWNSFQFSLFSFALPMASQMQPMVGFASNLQSPRTFTRGITLFRRYLIAIQNFAPLNSKISNSLSSHSL